MSAENNHTSHIEINQIETPEQHIVLTKRGKRVLTAVGLTAAGAGLAMTMNTLHNSIEPEFSDSTHIVEVDDNETLSQIANTETVNGRDYTGEVVKKIEELNPGVDPGELQEGDTLEVPDKVDN